MKQMSKSNKHCIFVLVLIFIVSGTLFRPLPALAAPVSCWPFTCFGGRILMIIPPIPFVCWVPQYVIGPPNPLVVAVVPGISRVYRYGIFELLNFTLGKAVPPIPGICATAYIIYQVGTSATP